MASDLKGLELKDYENAAREQALPFLRICTLYRHHLFGDEIPTILSEEQEFPKLLNFLKIPEYVMRDETVVRANLDALFLPFVLAHHKMCQLKPAT